MFTFTKKRLLLSLVVTEKIEKHKPFILQFNSAQAEIEFETYHLVLDLDGLQNSVKSSQLEVVLRNTYLKNNPGHPVTISYKNYDVSIFNTVNNACVYFHQICVSNRLKVTRKSHSNGNHGWIVFFLSVLK